MSLPNSWVVTPLSNLLDQIVGGGTPSKAIAANFIGTVPFMTVKDMKARFISDTVDHISEEAVESSATTKIPADTLVVATRMSLGKIVRPSVEVAINQDLKALFPFAEINKKYIEYFWRSKSDFIQSKGTGTTVKGIRIEDIKNLEVPLSPENEQRRIADKLDTVLTRVDAVQDCLARITPLLKRFRQSILVAATSGRLTEEWRQEFSSPQAHTTTLKQIIKVSSGDGLTSKNMNSAGGIPVFGGNGVNGTHDKSNINESTIVIGRVGYYCGSVHLTPEKAWITDNALKVNFDKNSINKKFLYYGLLGTDLRKNVSSTAQPVISSAKIYGLPFRLPSLEEQTEIVRRVELLMGYADRLEDRLQAAQTAAERLTPALLAKAFRGELVPQDPNDEPAAELLRRLREAHATEAPAKPKRGRKAAAA